MRIGIFDPYLDTLSGGEKYILSVASCLGQEHAVSIFWDKDKEIEIKQAALKKLGLDISSIKFCPNIFDKKVSLLSRIIQSRQFDLIIYLSDGSVPIVGTKLYIHFQFPIEWIEGNSIKKKIKLFCVKKIFCNSYFTKYFIDRKLGVKSKVLYPPIKINFPTRVKKENTILHVGRLSLSENEINFKKQDVMINAFKKMIDGGLIDWRFVLAIGVKSEDKDKANDLREMTNGYPIEIIENPSNQILWSYYAKAKIYWHATGFGEDLGKHPERAEHFGISTVEAMGAGVVPVAINAGGQKEIIEDGKNGYLWNTLEELAIKTRSLSEDKNLWNEMSVNAVNRSKIFSGDRFCKDLKNIIK